MARTLNDVNKSGELTDEPKIGSTDAADELLKKSTIEALIPTVTATYDIKADDDNVIWIQAPNM